VGNYSIGLAPITRSANFEPAAQPVRSYCAIPRTRQSGHKRVSGRIARQYDSSAALGIVKAWHAESSGWYVGAFGQTYIGEYESRESRYYRGAMARNKAPLYRAFYMDRRGCAYA